MGVRAGVCRAEKERRVKGAGALQGGEAESSHEGEKRTGLGGQEGDATAAANPPGGAWARLPVLG